MIDDPKIYGVIVESKCERALIMEGAPATYDDACKRMKEMAARPGVIRVAVFRAVYADGHEDLVPRESEGL